MVTHRSQKHRRAGLIREERRWPGLPVLAAAWPTLWLEPWTLAQTVQTFQHQMLQPTRDFAQNISNLSFIVIAKYNKLPWNLELLLLILYLFRVVVWVSFAGSPWHAECLYQAIAPLYARHPDMSPVYRAVSVPSLILANDSDHECLVSATHSLMTSLVFTSFVLFRRSTESSDACLRPFTCLQHLALAARLHRNNEQEKDHYILLKTLVKEQRSI